MSLVVAAAGGAREGGGGGAGTARGNELNFNHGWTRIDTDVRSIRKIQGIALFRESVFVRVYPWLKTA